MSAVATYVRIVVNRHIGGFRMAAIISFSEARNRLRPAAVPQMKPQTQTRPADAANLENQIADAGMLLLVRLGGLTMTPGGNGGVSSHSSDDRNGTVLKPAHLADIERELAAVGVPREAAQIAATALGVRRNVDGKTISLPEDWWKRFDDQEDERLGKLYLAMIGLGRPRPELE